MERGVRETQKIERNFGRRHGGASMTGPVATSPAPRVDPIFVGDHPAMDLLNTIVRLANALVDVGHYWWCGSNVKTHRDDSSCSLAAIG